MTILETVSTPTESTIGPCSSWANTNDLCAPCLADVYALDADILDAKLYAASETLYVLSGSQFPGECEETIRPCSSRTYTPHSQPTVYFSGGRAYNEGGCGCSSSANCSCPALSEIRLPRRDIVTVDEVKVDGATLGETEYRLDPPNLLVSLTDPWKCCQDLSLADTEEDTWVVTYTYGLAPPALGVSAAAILACEFYMACEPSAFEGECRLPSNIISIARQGVTVAKLVGELFVPQKRGPLRFGITEIDLFLATYAPFGAPSIIISPDDPDMGRVVGA